jgi:integrating conjugative element membrane protein (TIGR03747 family)
MAVKTYNPKPSKRIMMGIMLLIFIGWLVLLAWGFSLWGLSGFNTAWDSMYDLSQKQTAAVSEFHEASVANTIKSWLHWLPLESISNKAAATSQKIKSELNTVLPESPSELEDITEDLINTSHQVGLLIGLSASILFIKVTILITAIPLFLLATTAGLVDGLNQRAIRTASLGRESSYVFHQLNHYFRRGLLLLLALWLVTPISIKPALLFVPVSILLSLMVSMTASRFKKYV